MHYSMAGKGELAYQYAMQAAEESSQIHGHEEAEYFLKLAVASTSDENLIAYAKEKLGELLVSMRRYSEAEQYLDEICSAASILENPHRLLAVKSNLLLISFKKASVPPDELAAEIIKWVKCAKSIEAHEVHVDLLKLLVQIGHNTGQQLMVLDAVHGLSELSYLVDSDKHAVAALTYSSNVLSLYQGVTPARPYAEEAVRRATGSRDRTAEIVAFSSRGMNHLQSGRLSEAEADFRRALSLIERYAAISYQQFVLNTYGVVLLERGSFEEARRVLGEAVELARNSAALQDLVVVTGNLLLVEYESGNREGAIGLAEEVIDLSVKATLLWCTIGAWSILGLYAIDRGDLEAARRCRDGLLSHATGRDFWISDASYAEIFLARLAVMEGDRSGALERLDRAIAAYTDREFFCRARLHLERARVIHPKDRIEAGRWVEEVRSMGMESGAEPLIIAADRVSKEFSAAASL